MQRKSQDILDYLQMNDSERKNHVNTLTVLEKDELSKKLLEVRKQLVEASDKKISSNPKLFNSREKIAFDANIGPTIRELTRAVRQIASNFRSDKELDRRKQHGISAKKVRPNN